MSNSKLQKKQIERCLSCRIGSSLIYAYMLIYGEEDYRDKKVKINIKKIIKVLESNKVWDEKLDKKKDKELWKRLSEIGDEEIKKMFDMLKGLSTDSAFKGETDMCFINIQPIIVALQNIHKNSKGEAMLENLTNLTTVLSTMVALNKKLQPNYDEDSAKEALGLFKKCNRNLDEKQTRMLRIRIKKIVSNFYDNVPESRFIIHGRGDCFLKSADYNQSKWENESKLDEEYKSYMNRVNDLSMEDKDIIHGYIKNAPKKFGNNLKLVMERQGMTEQDIAMLIDVTPSVIQSLEKCEATERSKEDIKRLCRALLVSEDVLYNGAGKIYGNWKMLLDKEGIKALQEADKSLNAHDKKVSAMEMKNFARGKIKELIERDDSEFYQMIKDAPELFCEEDINIYPDEKDGFKNLLHKEEAYTLLKVLEKKN